MAMGDVSAISSRFFHYSFLDGTLIGSEHPANLGKPQRMIEPFIAAGVRAILTLTPAFQDFHTPSLKQFHVPIRDMPAREQIVEAVATVREQLAQGRSIWVHCQHGIDRTGCVIGSYLASIGQPPDDVIRELYAKFPERRQQRQMIELWKPYEAMIRSFAIA
jgi:protein-tyrosine phosphatase